jgi:hypothetical protein
VETPEFLVDLTAKHSAMTKYGIAVADLEKLRKED